MKTILLATLLSLTVSSCLVTQAKPRDRAARADFQRHNPCPANGQRRGPCPGYVVDHVIPLACGGPDRPDNMQWQTVEDGRAKDRLELNCNG